MAGDTPAFAVVVTIESRALKSTLGPLAWAVLEDVALDAVLQDGRWLAATSTRQLADHLGLTPGTVARALARLCAEGLVHREDRRDTRTGRFGESIYVVASRAALLPCVDSPHTVRRDTASPNTATPSTAPPPEASPSEASPSKGDQGTASASRRRPGSSGRRRMGEPEQQQLLGDGEPATTCLPPNSSMTATINDLQADVLASITQDPKTQDPTNPETLNPITQRRTDTCQLSQALPGRASC